MMNQELAECAAVMGGREKPAPKAARIPVKCRQRNRFIPGFLAGTAVLTVISLLYLEIDWLKMLSRVPDIGVVFWELAHLDFANMDLIFSSLVETISIAVLSLWESFLECWPQGIFSASRFSRF